MLWLSNVSVTFLCTSVSTLGVNVCAILPPLTPPDTLSELITSLAEPSAQFQVYCTTAPLVLVVVFSKYIVVPSSQCVNGTPPVGAAYARNETTGSPVKIAI